MLKKILAGWGLLTLAVLLGCPSKPPAPSPTPSPTPDLALTPARGVPVAPEMLLRPAPGARVALKGQPFNAFMAVPCCNTFFVGGVEKNSRWPMASEEWMDYTSSFGANMWHMRMGPFIGTPEVEVEWADVGGTYLPHTLEPNEAHRQKKRDLVYYALRLGGLVEVATTDTWGCKADQNGMVPGGYTGLPAAEIDACGRRPSPEIEKHIRRQVEDLGCFGNVIWSLDVEGGNINYGQPAWFLWARDMIRDEEQKSGCGFVHMIGTNSGMSEVETQVDYIQVHDRSDVVARHGRWTINNEHNPECFVDCEVGRFAAAREKGLAWAAWRAGMDELTYEAVLKGFQAVAGGDTAGCFAPDAEDERWRPGPVIGGSPLLSAVNAAKAEVGDRRHLWPTGGTSEQQFAAMFETLELVSAALRRQGLCASRSRDAIFVKAEDGLWHEFHVVAATDGGYTGQPFKGSTWIYQ